MIYCLYWLKLSDSYISENCPVFIFNALHWFTETEPLFQKTFKVQDKYVELLDKKKNLISTNFVQKFWVMIFYLNLVTSDQKRTHKRMGTCKQYWINQKNGKPLLLKMSKKMYILLKFVEWMLGGNMITISTCHGIIKTRKGEEVFKLFVWADTCKNS